MDESCRAPVQGMDGSINAGLPYFEPYMPCHAFGERCLVMVVVQAGFCGLDGSQSHPATAAVTEVRDTAMPVMGSISSSTRLARTMWLDDERPLIR